MDLNTKHLALLILSFMLITFHHHAQAKSVRADEVSKDSSSPSLSPNLQPAQAPAPGINEEDYIAHNPSIHPTTLLPSEPDLDEEDDSDIDDSNPPDSSVLRDKTLPLSAVASKLNKFKSTFTQSESKKMVDPKIKKICESTDYPQICLSTIGPFLTGKTDTISVLEIVIKACVQHAKLALKAAKQLSKKSGVSQILSSGADVCRENFEDALDNLQRAMDAIPGKDIGTINSMLSAVVTDAGSCEDAFQEGPVPDSDEEPPMKIYYDKLSKMASNCLAVASLIQ
ncbi:Pectinesterase inhibitor domain [Dillenia turbinata]|uniref:Pectinesterase inhibitor domain n=1 Tax=Dillenia turbinata TaxID=194707 RepID=A0AAN8ZCW1_9MAGN